MEGINQDQIRQNRVRYGYAGHFRGLKDPLEVRVEHETQNNYVPTR